HRHADERRAAEEEQHRRRGRKAGGERREGVEQDAPHQHAPAAEDVGQVAAEQAEGAAGERRHPEEPAPPRDELRTARRHAQQLQHRGPRDERQHQQLVDVEGETEGGDEADQPLGAGERRRGGGRRGHEAVLCASFTIPEMAPRRSLWPYLARLPLVAWTFAGPLFFGLVPYFRDVGYYYYPNEVFLERSLREGVWPLWNPTSDAGAPFLTTDAAELLLIRATSALGALRFGPPLHLLVAMCGASFLAAVLGAGVWGIWVAGLAYGLSGYFLSTVNLMQLNHAAAWAPWVIAAALGLWSSPSMRRVAFAAAVAALQVSTLGAEIVVQTALVTLVLLPSRPDRRKLGAAAAAVVLAVLLAMPALLGVQSLVSGTSRGAGFAPAVGFSFSLPKALLLDVVLPRAFGDVHTFTEQNYWGQPFFPDGYPYLMSLYCGPALLWLALRAPRSSLTWKLLALALLGVLLALGDHGPLGWLLAPLVRHFRAPVKLLFLTNLALALLAARGLDRARRETLRPAWLALATGVLLVALAVAVR